jgi:hypothetical protein
MRLEDWLTDAGIRYEYRDGNTVLRFFTPSDASNAADVLKREFPARSIRIADFNGLAVEVAAEDETKLYGKLFNPTPASIEEVKLVPWNGWQTPRVTKERVVGLIDDLDVRLSLMIGEAMLDA